MINGMILRIFTDYKYVTDCGHIDKSFKENIISAIKNNDVRYLSLNCTQDKVYGISNHKLAAYSYYSQCTMQFMTHALRYQIQDLINCDYLANVGIEESNIFCNKNIRTMLNKNQKNDDNIKVIRISEYQCTIEELSKLTKLIIKYSDENLVNEFILLNNIGLTAQKYKLC